MRIPVVCPLIIAIYPEKKSESEDPQFKGLVGMKNAWRVSNKKRSSSSPPKSRDLPVAGRSGFVVVAVAEAELA